VARALVEKGAEVHALARSDSDRSMLNGWPIIWHEGDITRPETLTPFLNGATEIIHAAGCLGQAGVSEDEYLRINTRGVQNVMSTALQLASRPRVLHISTTGVLGPLEAELPEEDAPLAPSNPYERSKAEAEKVAQEFASRGLDVVIARPGFLYGPGDRHVLGLFKAVQSGWFFYIDGGHHVCHPSFISDAVNGILLCLKKGRGGEAYHLTGPTPVTFREFANIIAAALSVKPPRLNLPRLAAHTAAYSLEAISYVTGKHPPLSRSGVAFFSESRAASWRKAKDELGYIPACDVAKGVSCTVLWYQKQGWLAPSRN